MANGTHSHDVAEVIGSAAVLQTDNVVRKHAAIFFAFPTLVGIALECLHADALPFAAG